MFMVVNGVGVAQCLLAYWLDINQIWKKLAEQVQAQLDMTDAGHVWLNLN